MMVKLMRSSPKRRTMSLRATMPADGVRGRGPTSGERGRLETAG